MPCTIARLLFQLGSLSNRCLGARAPSHPSIFLAENLFNVRSLLKHIFFNFRRVMFVFIRQKIVTWCWKKCHLQTMNCSSTNWRVILISFLEVWRNKTLKLGKMKIWKHVLSHARVSPALAARLTRKLHYSMKGLENFFRKIERKRLFGGRMDGCKVISDATSTCSINNFD